MRRLSLLLGGLVVLALLALACGPAAPAAQPAKAAAPAAQPAKPATEPAKPAAPAAQPAKPAAEAKPAAPAAQPATKGMRQIVHGTSQLSSAYGIYSAAVVNLLNKKVPGVNITLVENVGIVNNLKRMRAGEADFAMGDHMITFMAYDGLLKGWEDNPQKDLRLLWVFTTIANALVVSERAGVDSIPALNGKAFSPGGQGSSAEVTSLQSFDVLGIKPQWYRGSMSEMVQAFKDRRIVGFVKAMNLDRSDPLILDAQTTTPLRVVSWPDDLVKKVQAKYPYFKTVQVQAGVFKDAEWNKQPITTWGSPNGIFASTKLPEDVAYEFVKTALKEKDDQVAAFPTLKNDDLGKLTVEYGLVPLHKGAVKALREAGYQPPKELVPAEAQ
ncbi:MAG: TAXI family TRAP transporter solute-binding subunit [Chloroflexi bacterium]|nr:TAXI family TRAP transporter solute-binding subunit [Chloroflexota bacterium]